MNISRREFIKNSTLYVAAVPVVSQGFAALPNAFTHYDSGDITLGKLRRSASTLRKLSIKPDDNGFYVFRVDKNHIDQVQSLEGLIRPSSYTSLKPLLGEIGAVEEFRIVA